MVFDEKLAARVRAVLAKGEDPVTERLMFGGICFLVDGSMCCGVLKNDLIVKVGNEAGEKALDEPHTRPFDFTGKPMTGMLYVAPAGTKNAASLGKWLKLGLAHAREKARSTSKRRRKR